VRCGEDRIDNMATDEAIFGFKGVRGVADQS
jgi:hypothetical protein